MNASGVSGGMAHAPSAPTPILQHDEYIGILAAIVYSTKIFSPEQAVAKAVAIAEAARKAAMQDRGNVL